MDLPASQSERQEGDILTFEQEVMCHGTRVHVTVTKEGTVVENWIQGQTNETIFGLDVEWKPNRTRGEINKVSLLQISSPTECLLVQLLYLDFLPDFLREFLQHQSKSFAGVGITEDALKLFRDHGLQCKGLVELKNYNMLGNRSLKDLARLVLHFDMNKSRAITLSDWSRPQLDSEQVEYGCLDAWTSLAIYSELKSAPKRKFAAHAFEQTRFIGVHRMYGSGRKPR